MPETVDEWSDQHWDRAFARQSAQADNIKLVTTFALALAGTMVATTLQVDPQNQLDVWASIILGVGFLLTHTVIFMDRLKWVSHRKVLQKQIDKGWSDARLLEYIRKSSRQAEEENETLIRYMKRIAEYQLIMSGAAGTLAIISLFR